MRRFISGLLVSLSIAASACTVDGEAEVTCEDMCTHLRSEILDGCDKADADTQEGCVSECEEHVAQGEVDQNGLQCGVEAGTCSAWELCGDFL